MTRIRSLRFALPLALLLAAAAVPTTMVPAMAFDGTTDWKFITQWNGTGASGDHYVGVMYQDPDTKSIMIERWWDNGTYTVNIVDTTAQWTGKGDPGPDDPSSKGSGIEPPNVAAMLAHAKGVTIHISASVKEGTPLAGWLESEGRGGSIRWNPPDDSDTGGPGQPPTGHTGGLTPKQLASIIKQVNFSAKSLAAIGSSMGDGVDGLAGESAPTPNKTGGRGTGTSDGKGDGDNKTKWRGGGEVVTLGPRPDLVNPAPKNKTGSSKFGAPKLLHTNKGFSHSGPTATGKWFRGGAPGGNLR